MFGLMNKKMNEASIQGKNGENNLKELMNGFFGEDYISKMMDIMFKYYKIEIEKINYIFENKAYVEVKLRFPVNLDEIKNISSIDKILKNLRKLLRKKQEK